MSYQTAETPVSTTRVPWNKGKLTGQKRPFTLKQIWEIRIRLQIAGRTCDLALFNLGIDSKLRGCDLVRLRVSDVAHGDQILSRTKVIQKKTGRPASFELTPETRGVLRGWIAEAGLSAGDFVLQSHRPGPPPHDAPVCAARTRLGRHDRGRPERVRHPLPTSLEGDSDLSADEEPPSGAALARAHKARINAALSWRGGRRRA